MSFVVTLVYSEKKHNNRETNSMAGEKPKMGETDAAATATSARVFVMMQVFNAPRESGWKGDHR
jgi:hypothetical protein